jgi:hypothetical protein
MGRGSISFCPVVARTAVRQKIVIPKDKDRDTMSLHHVVVLAALLISAMSLAGCTGSLPQAVATPAPLPVATAMPAPPAPAETVARYVTYAAGTAVIQLDHPSSQTLSFNGAADYDQLTFTTERDESWLCDLTYPGTGVFTVTLKNDRGETIDVLANEAGSGTRQKTVRLAAGNYYFDIRADAPWNIIMRTG